MIHESSATTATTAIITTTAEEKESSFTLTSNDMLNDEQRRRHSKTNAKEKQETNARDPTYTPFYLCMFHAHKFATPRRKNNLIYCVLNVPNGFKYSSKCDFSAIFSISRETHMNKSMDVCVIRTQCSPPGFRMRISKER